MFHHLHATTLFKYCSLSVSKTVTDDLHFVLDPNTSCVDTCKNKAAVVAVCLIKTLFTPLALHDVVMSHCL